VTRTIDKSLELEPVDDGFFDNQSEDLEATDDGFFETPKNPIVHADVQSNTSIAKIEEAAEDKNIEDDYKFARKNMRALISSGMDMVDSLAEVAIDSEHPRAYEVLSGLIKNISDQNKELLELTASKKKMKTIGKEGPSQVTQNAFFVGKTSDLVKMINDAKVTPDDDTGTV